MKHLEHKSVGWEKMGSKKAYLLVAKKIPKTLAKSPQTMSNHVRLCGSSGLQQTILEKPCFKQCAFFGGIITISHCRCEAEPGPHKAIVMTVCHGKAGGAGKRRGPGGGAGAGGGQGGGHGDPAGHDGRREQLHGQDAHQGGDGERER